MNSKPAKTQDTPRRKTPRRITESYLHNAGLFYLQRFAASSGRFREVMLRKVRKSCRHHADQDPAECRRMVDELVVKFLASGLLNDEAYARGVVTSMRRQGKSGRAIQAKLKTRGIDGDTSAFDSPEAEWESAMIFARKKKIGPFRIAKDTDPEKELAALGRAGFSYETARRVLAMEVVD